MRTHHINIVPTTYVEMKPYNYKIISRFSRMSGLDKNLVETVFDEEYEILKAEKEANDAANPNENKAEVTKALLSILYQKVKNRLEIPTSFESVSKVHGFNLDKAETYLLSIGYSEKFVKGLKTSPKITLIHYPKYLDTKYKKKFETYFEKKILAHSSLLEHPIVFYARTIASFITHLYEKNLNPFSKLAINSTTLPISALKNLYNYKFDVVLRYVKTLNGFSFLKFGINKEVFLLENETLKNFKSFGKIQLKPKNEKSFNELSIGSKLINNKKLRFNTEKGVTIVIQRERNLISLKFCIKVDTYFRTYGIKNVGSWIKKYVVKPRLIPSFELNRM